MIVEDVMTKEVFSVHSDQQISKVASLLAEKKLHALPVVDDENKIIGIVSETDFFSKENANIYLPSFIDFIRSESLEKVSQKNPTISYVANSTVEDIMTKECFYVDPKLKLEDLIKIFQESGFKTIPVGDEKGILRGIVTVSDMIKLI